MENKEIGVGAKRITDYLKPRLVPSNLEQHQRVVLDVLLRHSGEFAFGVVRGLREEFRICTGSAYNLLRKLSGVGVISYVPREPIGFAKLFSVPSRYVSIDVDAVMRLPKTLGGLAWAKNIKVDMVSPGIVRWVYEGARKDGKKPPVLFIMGDGIYENPRLNSQLDVPQRAGIAERAVFRILRQYNCLSI
ncbi:hypothetical protein DRQ25_00295 [Candidatus Fermentibacteria bacterium]|nr:MAG: hypothetical protein DRQ25_00295 [Candidatus Fermentibacteria bacterium]